MFVVYWFFVWIKGKLAFRNGDYYEGEYMNSQRNGQGN